MTFAPIIQCESLRIFLIISTLLRFLVEQIDIARAYLESLMEDNNLPIFMKLPLRMRNFWLVRIGLVCRFLRSNYGLTQSGRLWNQNVIIFFKTLGFKLLNVNLSIFILTKDRGEILMINVYIDDFLFVLNSLKALLWLKKSITKKYNVKDLKKM